MEDVTYADEPEVALPKLLAMVPLVTPRGSLVINRHRHGDPKPMARTLRLYFERREDSPRAAHGREHADLLLAPARQSRRRRLNRSRCGRSASAPSRLRRSAS